MTSEYALFTRRLDTTTVGEYAVLAGLESAVTVLGAIIVLSRRQAT